MALSYQTAVSDGTLTQLNLAIEYASRDEITVYIDGIYIPSTIGRYGWQGAADPIILFNTPIPAGQVLLVRRTTNLNRVRNIFTAGAQFNPATLDENFIQVLRVAQEVLENARGDVSPNDAVRSFNGRTADVILTSSDVTQALGYQPAQVGSGPGGGMPSASIVRVFAYQRAPVIPTASPGDVIFNFGTGSISTPLLEGGWLKQIPEGDYPLWVTVATANSTSDTDQIGSLEWTTPVILTKNGLNGLNTATVTLYQRTNSGTTPPGPPTGNVTYTFANGIAANLSNGWSGTVPAYVTGKKFLWATLATAASTEGVDVILPSEWATASILSADGADGASGNGSPGSDGQRGTVQIAQGGYTAWSNAAATAAVSAAGYGAPVNRDIVTLYGTGFSEARFYNNGSWLVLNAYINGNMLVSGTLSASMVSAGVLDGSRVLFGTGHTPSGRAFEINSVGAVHGDNFFGGILNANNFYATAAPGVLGVTTNNSALAGVQGLVAATNTNTGTAALYGQNARSGAAGLVGTSMSPAYDFYANGSGTNYGPFTGAHDAMVDKEYTVEIGDLVVDYLAVSRANLSNTVFEVRLSSVPNQPAAIGVVTAVPGDFSGWIPSAFIDHRDENWNPVPTAEYAAAALKYNLTAVNAIGEGQMNVTGENGDIAAGDLIVTSSTPGKGMRQDDNIVRSHTVARSREAITFATPGEVKQVACIYMCG